MSEVSLGAQDMADGGTLDPDELGQKPQTPSYRPDDAAEWGGSFPKPDYKGSTREVPDQGSASQVSALVDWEDLTIRIRENLMERLAKSIEDLANSARPGALGDPRALIQQVRDAIANVWQKIERDIILNWEFTIQDSNSGIKNLLIEHFHTPDIQHDYDAVPGLGGGSTAPEPKLFSRIATSVKVQGRTRSRLRIEIEKSGVGTDVEERSQADVVVASGSQIVITSSTRVSLRFVGFREELLESAQKLGGLFDAIGAVVGAGLDAVKAAIEAWWNDEAGAPGNPGVAKSSGVMEAVSAALESFIEYMKANVKRMLDKWTGHAQLRGSSIVVTCLSEQGATRVRALLASAALEQAQKAVSRREEELSKLQADRAAIAKSELEILQVRRAVPAASKVAVSLGFAERLARGDAKALTSLAGVSKRLRDSRGLADLASADFPDDSADGVGSAPRLRTM